MQKPPSFYNGRMKLHEVFYGFRINVAGAPGTRSASREEQGQKQTQG